MPLECRVCFLQLVVNLVSGEPTIFLGVWDGLAAFVGCTQSTLGYAQRRLNAKIICFGLSSPRYLAQPSAQKKSQGFIGLTTVPYKRAGVAGKQCAHVSPKRPLRILLHEN